MKTADFDFDLPREMIADRPARPRDSARLLTVGDRLGDHHVRDLPGLLRTGDLLVLNDTRVIPARLRGRRGAAKVEVTLHKQAVPAAKEAEHPGGRWFAFARPARRLREGDAIDFAGGLTAIVAEKGPEGEVLLDFGRAEADLLAALERAGEMPLPPYIPRPEGADAADREDYQTTYARRPGAVAAHTAGLHFTSALFDALEAAGIGRVFVTLHVGAGTFLPVKADEVEAHRMHAEWGEIGDPAAERINAARDAGGRIVAVGTTSLRLLESAADESGRIAPFLGETDIFIRPGVAVRSADLLLTNFHLPRSTLFMLVCAFAGSGWAGVERMKAAYEHAKAQGYRFYSYGDACLIERGP